MPKSFYTKRNNIKLFFDGKVKIRTVAYGEKINERFSVWLKLYSSFSVKEKDFLPFNQNDLFGAKAMPAIAFKSRPNYTLHLKNVKYSVDQGQFLLVNGERSLYLGNVKAFALYFCEEIGSDKLIALINYGAEGTKLTVFDLTDKGVTPSRIKPLKIESSIAVSDYLICAERHIFLIRDSVLNYFYINEESNEIEPVAIFEDKPFAETECCTSVVPFIVFDEEGRVFWSAGGHLYCTAVGFPKRVAEIDDYGKGEVSEMSCKDRLLKVKVKYRNESDKIYEYAFNGKRYEKKI